MLELMNKSSWDAPALSDEQIKTASEACRNQMQKSNTGSLDYLFFFRTEPYIDAMYLYYGDKTRTEPNETIRFIFHEGYCWSFEDREMFRERCFHNVKCVYSREDIERIFAFYSEQHPQWHLERYYTEDMKLLDHIYHCMVQNTASEILYKAGLDELAANISEIDELNLLATKPSDLYEGISLRTLRTLNCEEGAILLHKHEYREYILYIQSKYPDAFKYELNDAHCHYIRDMIEHRLTPGEVGRLFLEARPRLYGIWNDRQYNMYIFLQRQELEIWDQIRMINEIDPFYEKHFPQTPQELKSDDYNYREFPHLLLEEREEYDRAIRLSNRKREYAWQERTEDYIIRYPQTINDFCREAAYMKNCLTGYVEPIIHNDTTIMFMRRADSYNMPFITIEIHRNKLRQAYHRFNEDCNPEEADWIRAFCKRHKIDASGYHFDKALDMDIGGDGPVVVED